MTAPELDVKRLMDHAALFVAPTSFVTGLMYWIGWAKTQAYWAYFGIDQTILKFSTADYLIRAVNTAFTFLTMLILFAITVIVMFRAIESRRDRLQPFQLQLLEWALFTAGVLFFSRVALADLFPLQLGALDWAGWASRGTLVGPIFGVIGLLLVAYASHLHVSRHDSLHKPESRQLRRSRLLLLGLAAALIVLATFLAAGRYAEWNGIEAAMAEAADPQQSYRTDIFSKERLQIVGSGLTEVRLDPGEDAGQERYRFRYSGLRLLRYSRGNYFLVSLDDLRSFVFPESPDIRVEFLGP